MKNPKLDGSSRGYVHEDALGYLKIYMPHQAVKRFHSKQEPGQRLKQVESLIKETVKLQVFRLMKVRKRVSWLDVGLFTIASMRLAVVAADSGRRKSLVGITVATTRHRFAWKAK